MSKRKTFQPRHAANPLAFVTAIRGACRFTASEQLQRAARLRCSVEELIASRGTMAAWADVFDAVNMIEAFGQLGTVRDAREFVEAHQQNVVDAMDRQKETGSNVLRPAECAMLRDLAATWAEVLAVVTYREFFAAEERVTRKVQQALRRGSHGNVRVVVAA